MNIPLRIALEKLKMTLKTTGFHITKKELGKEPTKLTPGPLHWDPFEYVMQKSGAPAKYKDGDGVQFITPKEFQKAKEHYLVPLEKASPTEDEDGVLTKFGMAIAHKYALKWTKQSVRDLELERAHPELAGLFYDIRADVELASEHALEG